MSNPRDDTAALQAVRTAEAEGLEPGGIAERLHQEGFAMVTAVKAVREGLGVSLGEAKETVEGSPAWSREVKASEALREELLTNLDEIVGEPSRPRDE